MKAEPMILQMKYADIIDEIAWKARISYDDAMKVFYGSKTYYLIHKGISDMHCRSVAYIVEDILAETDISEFERYITIDEYVKTTSISKKTIVKNRKYIKKVIEIRNQHLILEEARYPYRLKCLNVKNAEDARYHILKAMNEYRYIDNELLGISRSSFDFIVEELLTNKLIKKNKSGNMYGLNGYDITGKGTEVFCENKQKTIRTIAQALGSYSGAFVGSITG